MLAWPPVRVSMAFPQAKRGDRRARRSAITRVEMPSEGAQKFAGVAAATLGAAFLYYQYVSYNARKRLRVVRKPKESHRSIHSLLRRQKACYFHLFYLAIQPALNIHAIRTRFLLQVGVIPARFASTRFPGKPLVKILGKPMIQVRSIVQYAYHSLCIRHSWYKSNAFVCRGGLRSRCRTG